MAVGPTQEPMADGICRWCKNQVWWYDTTDGTLSWRGPGLEWLCKSSPHFDIDSEPVAYADGEWPRHEVKPMPHPNDTAAVAHWLDQ